MNSGYMSLENQPLLAEQSDHPLLTNQQTAVFTAPPFSTRSAGNWALLSLLLVDATNSNPQSCIVFFLNIIQT